MDWSGSATVRPQHAVALPTAYRHAGLLPIFYPYLYPKSLMSTSSVTEIAQKLIRFDTTNPPGNELACVQYVNELLTEAGFETLIVAKDANRPNLLTRLPGRGEAPPLLMQGHVDVVTTEGQDWTRAPFEGEIIDGVLWGRGALDMKGGVAMMISALLQAYAEGIEPAGDIILCVLADEENGGNFGARFLVEEHAALFEGVRYGIGEFGGFALPLAGKTFYPIQIAEKVGLHLTAKLNGPAGHASGIFQDGAMGKTGALLTQLNRLRLPTHLTPAVRLMVEGLVAGLDFPAKQIMGQLLRPGLTGSVLKLMGAQAALLEPLFRHTINPTIIKGGNKSNVIPSEIDLTFDVRMLPGYSAEQFMSELKSQLQTDAIFETTSEGVPSPAEPDMGLFPILADILKGADPDGIPIPFVLQAVTDARFFNQLGIQTYGFTPLQLPPEYNLQGLAHAADERVPVSALEFGQRAVFELIKRYR